MTWVGANRVDGAVKFHYVISRVARCKLCSRQLSRLDDTTGLNFCIRPLWFIAGFFFFFFFEREDQQIGLREETLEGNPGNPPQISRAKKFGNLSGLILFRLEVPRSYVDAFEREPGGNTSSTPRDVMYVPRVLYIILLQDR